MILPTSCSAATLGATALLRNSRRRFAFPIGSGVILPIKTILFDISGTHPAAPTYRSNNARHPGVSARDSMKNNNFAVPCLCRLSLTHGSANATKPIKQIDDDAFQPCLGLPASTYITSGNVHGLPAVDWQRDINNLAMVLPLTPPAISSSVNFI